MLFVLPLLVAPLLDAAAPPPPETGGQSNHVALSAASVSTAPGWPEARAALALARSRMRSAAVDVDAAQRQLNLYTAMPEKMLNGAPLLQTLPPPAQTDPRVLVESTALSVGLTSALRSPPDAPAHLVTSSIASSESPFQVKPNLPGANLVGLARLLHSSTATTSPPHGESASYFHDGSGWLDSAGDFSDSRPTACPTEGRSATSSPDQVHPTSPGVFDNVPGYN